VDWACDPTAGGQQRTYRGDELKIHGDMCVNAKGKGTSGSPVMLWSCNGGQNEIWVHRSDREYALMVGGYRQCLTDPGYSTTNGTQLRVAACTGASDQQWSPP
jgi:endo-1,4-beta-xylanase